MEQLTLSEKKLAYIVRSIAQLITFANQSAITIKHLVAYFQ